VVNTNTHTFNLFTFGGSRSTGGVFVCGTAGGSSVSAVSPIWAMKLAPKTMLLVSSSVGSIRIQGDKKNYYYLSNPTSSIIMVVLLQKENEEEEVNTHVVLHSHIIISFWRELSSVHRHKLLCRGKIIGSRYYDVETCNFMGENLHENRNFVSNRVRG
jgi:hypothetical protein